MTNVFTAEHREKIYLLKIVGVAIVAAFMAERNKDTNASAYEWEFSEGGRKDAGMRQGCGMKETGF